MLVAGDAALLKAEPTVGFEVHVEHGCCWCCGEADVD